MPVKIRLMRIGSRKRPFYRVVAVDERKKRTGGYLDLLGTYNPLSEPKEIKLDQKKIDEWVKKGAVYSPGFLRIIGKAPQRPPRKPKKAKKEEIPSTQKVTPPIEEAKLSDKEATSEVEQSSQPNESPESGAQQTGSEIPNNQSESTQTELSGASITNEPTKKSAEPEDNS